MSEIQQANEIKTQINELIGDAIAEFMEQGILCETENWNEAKQERFKKYMTDYTISRCCDPDYYNNEMEYFEEEDEEEDEEEIKEFRLTDKYNYIKEQIYDLYDPDEEYDVEEFKVVYGTHKDSLDWYDFEITGDEWVSANQFISDTIPTNTKIDYIELKRQVLLKIMNECKF